MKKLLTIFLALGTVALLPALGARQQSRTAQGDASLAKNKQLEVVEAKEPKEEQSIAFEAGKFCLDIAKLVFGGVILAGIMQQGIEFNSLFLTGLGVVLLFVHLAFT